MKLLKCNEKISSYKLPIIKVISCSLLIVLIISLNSILPIDNHFWNELKNIVAAIVVALSVLCIYISFCEMLLLSERRELAKVEIKKAMKSSKFCSVDRILSLLEANDIIEILIISNQQIIKLGASSDSHPWSSQFFDKKYYIDDFDCIEIEEIKEKLNSYSVDAKVQVVTIDGISPNK